ncbi:MAG: hypothetical protein V4703_12925, partial [Actinomycetota bacterium]
MTDEWLAARMTSQPDRLRAILNYLDKCDARPPTASDEAPVGGARDETDEPPELAPPLNDDKETAAPGKPTPLFTGRTKQGIAAPGTSPTPLHTGKKTRKGWAL